MASSSNEISTYFERCRCCLNYGYLKNMWQDHFREGEKEIYVVMLVQCFGLSWEAKDNSPKNDWICEVCISRLREACDFKKLVLQSQVKLEHIDEGSDIDRKIEKFDSSLEDQQLEIEDAADDESVDPCYVDVDKPECEDPDDPDYEDIDDPDYVNLVKPDYVEHYETEYLEEDEPNDMEYENIEYLEDEDSEIQTSQQTRRIARRPRKSDTSTGGRKWPKKLPKSERYKTYKQYTEEELRECLAAVRQDKLSTKEAAEKYNIPQKTIAAKLRQEPKDDQNGTTKEKGIKLTKFRENLLKINDIMHKAAEIKQNNANMVSKNRFKEKDEASENKSNIKVKKDIIDTKIDDKKLKSKYKTKTAVNKNTKGTEQSDCDEMNKHKNNIRIILECSNATLIKGTWKNGYSCCFCKTENNNPLEIKAHNLKMHADAGHQAIKAKYVSVLVIRLDITGLTCKLCGRNIETLETLTEHLAQEHNKNIYKDIKNHIIPFKFNTDILQCVKCNKEFKYFKLLREHMGEHYPNYECNLCDRTFVNKQSMQTHSYRHKSGVFKCLHCPKVFDTRPKRSVHERVTHTLFNKTRKCTYCDERFSTKDLVRRHESKIHGVKLPVFNCTACNKSYNSHSTLVTHKKRFHLMLRPHKCAYCDMAFFSKVELSSHTVTHTKTRNFKCNICSKCFGTRCSLKQHLRVHINDKRFKCDNCDRAFTQRTAFRVHMRSKHSIII